MHSIQRASPRGKSILHIVELFGQWLEDTGTCSGEFSAPFNDVLILCSPLLIFKHYLFVSLAPAHFQISKKRVFGSNMEIGSFRKLDVRGKGEARIWGENRQGQKYIPKSRLGQVSHRPRLHEDDPSSSHQGGVKIIRTSNTCKWSLWQNLPQTDFDGFDWQNKRHSTAQHMTTSTTRARHSHNMHTHTTLRHQYM